MSAKLLSRIKRAGSVNIITYDVLIVNSAAMRPFGTAINLIQLVRLSLLVASVERITR